MWLRSAENGKQTPWLNSLWLSQMFSSLTFCENTSITKSQWVEVGVGGWVIWQHSKHLCYCDSAILDKTTSRPRHQGFGGNQLQTSKFTRKRSNWVLSSWTRFSHIFCLSSHLKLETSVLWEVTWMTFTQVLHESILIHYVCYVCSHWNLAHIDITCNGLHSQRSSSICSIALHHKYIIKFKQQA